MNFRKWLTLIVGLVFAGLLLTACGAGATPAGTQPPPPKAMPVPEAPPLHIVVLFPDDRATELSGFVSTADETHDCSTYTPIAGSLVITEDMLSDKTIGWALDSAIEGGYDTLVLDFCS